MKILLFRYTSALLLILAMTFLNSCMDSKKESRWSADKYRKAAAVLVQRELYREAAELYEKYLYSSSITEEDIPKVLYQTGNIYLENLHSPRKALAKYSILKNLYPGKTFNGSLGKKIVACLEKSGRSIDAKQALSSITNLVQEAGDTLSGSQIAAEIDGRKISLNEIEQSLGKLPDSPLERNQAVSQYVSQLMIADAGKRKGLDQNQTVKRRIAFAATQILAQANLREQLKISPPSQNDLKYFYEAHKQKYSTGPDSAADYQKLLPKITADWQREKQSEKYQQYVSGLLKSDRVKIYSLTAGK